MKFGLLDYQFNSSSNQTSINLGDYIQSIAAAQFLPRIDTYICREKLHLYKGEKLFLIMNGWFMHKPLNWPPSSDIHPLFISFHITTPSVEYLTSDESITYLKKYEPIGCRDEFTENILKSKGINAYFSGCLTLTLNKKNFIRKNDQIIKKNIIINDLGERKDWYLNVIKEKIRNIKAYFKERKIINKLLTSREKKQILRKLNTIRFNENIKRDDRFKLANDLLRDYANAKLVITSRIHTALPCMAFGTPVIFIDKSYGKDDRFGKLLKFIPHIFLSDIKKGQIPNREKLLLPSESKNKCATTLKNTVRNHLADIEKNSI